MKLKKITASLLTALYVIFATACNNDAADKDDSRYIVKTSRASLSRADLSRVLPGGMSAEDSVRYARAYIKSWIDSHLMSDIASDEIDLTDIDRLTADYRNHLIEMEYSRRMFDSHGPKAVSDDSIHNYYAEHRDEFKLERPMIKGLYLKVPEDAENIKAIRNLYRSDKQTDIDRLEKTVLSSAIHYDYFRDRWIDWEQIELHIPYDFGENPDAFLKGKKQFETTAGGFVYLLAVEDVLPTGATMPYENAKRVIEERLTAKQRQDYSATLKRQLYEKSLKDGKIKVFVELEPNF